MEIAGIIFELLKFIFIVIVWGITGLIGLIMWIIETVKETRAKKLRLELERANTARNSTETNTENFKSGEPDSIETQINENKELIEENIIESSSEEIISHNQKGVIKTPKYSRWDLLQPDKKEDINDKNNEKRETKDRWTFLKKIQVEDKKDKKGG